MSKKQFVSKVRSPTDQPPFLLTNHLHHFDEKFSMHSGWWRKGLLRSSRAARRWKEGSTPSPHQASPMAETASTTSKTGTDCRPSLRSTSRNLLTPFFLVAQLSYSCSFSIFYLIFFFCVICSQTLPYFKYFFWELMPFESNMDIIDPDLNYFFRITKY